jgi:hypothetical protein
MSDSIFSVPRPRTSGRAVPRSSIGDVQRPSAPALVAEPATLRTPTTVASTNDATLIGIVEAPLAHGMTAREGFLRKEAELRAAFASLPVATQRALHARLSNPRAGDELAAKFQSLTAERRTRLLTFLADARRREAQAAAR